MSQIASGKFNSQGFNVYLWKNEDDLFTKIKNRLNQVISKSLSGQIPSKKSEQLNLLFGLKRDGSVRGDSQSMRLDRFQILSPYRGNYFGTLGINVAIKEEYRKTHHLDSKIYGKPIQFTHSDKIISIANQYGYKGLMLSNGSIGVVNNVGSPYPQRRFFFSDLKEPMKTINSEQYEPAYAIQFTNHREASLNILLL